MPRSLIGLVVTLGLGAAFACGDSTSVITPTSIDIAVAGGKSDTIAQVGDTVSLSLAVHYGTQSATAQIPIWSSSNLRVITVTQSGIATAIGSGSAVVSATIGGVSGTITLTVIASP